MRAGGPRAAAVLVALATAALAACDDPSRCKGTKCLDPDAGLDAGLDAGTDAGAGGDGGCAVGFKAVSTALVGGTVAYLGPRTVALADLDGDGRLDAVVGVASPHYLHVLKGQGDGTFTQLRSVTLASPATGVAIADLDRDGHLDVVASSQDHDHTLLFGLDGGTFSPVRTARAPALCTGVAVGDVDRDGVPDLVASSRHLLQGGVYVTLGVGDGGFATAVEAGNEDALAQTVVADLNGDGRLDAASARGAGQGQVSVLLSTQAGPWADPRRYDAGVSPTAVAAGLLDGDDKPDLVVVSADGRTVTVLPNNGDGTFPVSAEKDAADALMTVAIGDVTGDGLLDVIAGGTQVSVYPGLGGGNLGTRTLLDSPAASLAVGDLNNDGRVDVLALSAGRLTAFLRGCW